MVGFPRWSLGSAARGIPVFPLMEVKIMIHAKIPNEVEGALGIARLFANAIERRCGRGRTHGEWRLAGKAANRHEIVSGGTMRHRFEKLNGLSFRVSLGSNCNARRRFRLYGKRGSILVF
jgi:hypothetical protein